MENENKQLKEGKIFFLCRVFSFLLALHGLSAGGRFWKYSSLEEEDILNKCIQGSNWLMRCVKECALH